MGTTIIGGSEDRCFRSFFGCNVEVFLIMYWHLIISNDLLPPDYHFAILGDFRGLEDLNYKLFNPLSLTFTVLTIFKLKVAGLLGCHL